MNKSFKVVFSKARSALMVVNEATSSIQAKGTKTVIAAAAAAMIAGGAVAATTSTTVIVNGDKEVANLAAGTAYDSYTIVGAGAFGALSVRNTGTTVKDVANLSFTNNTTSGKAGALALDKASLMLTDAQFSNNSAAGWGGAVRLWAPSGSSSALTLKTNRDLTYAGNKAGQGKTAEKDGSTALGARYEDMGGFAHLQGNSTLTLTAAANTTLTIGETGAAQTAGLDSITTSNGGNTLVIDGAGTVNLNGSLEGFVGGITVSSGTVNMATGFGSIDNDTQASVNSQTANASGATAGNVQSVLTVKSGATVNMGALTINRSTKADTVAQAGTQLKVEDGGKLYVESITLGTKEYKDKALGTTPNEKLASGSLTTTGYGAVDVASGAVAEVKKDVTVAAGTTFDKTNSGAFTVLGKLKTEAAVKDGAKEGAKEVSPAGVFNVNGGSVAVNTVANAGTTTVASGAVFSVTGTGSTNSGDISLQSGAKFVVKAGADLTNTGAIAGAKNNAGAYTSVGDVTVAGKLVNGGKGLIQTATLTVKDGGYVSTKITDAYAVSKTTVEKGGTFNLTELNSHLDGTAEGAFDQLLLAGGEVELAGGAVTVADKAFTGKVQLGVNILDEKNTPTSYSKATLTISAGEYAADTFTTLQNKISTDKSTLNVTGGQYTIKTLNANGGAINVAGTGKLVIDTKLSTDSGSAFTISQGGTVETTAAALGLKIGATGVTVDSGSTYKKTITNNGELVLSDLTGITTTKTYLGGIKATIQGDSTGLLNLGALTISDAVTDGKALFADVTGSGALAGIASDALSQATVTGVNGSFTKAGSYGKLEAATADAAATVSGAALTLNGTGDLFTYVSGSTTTVKGITLGTSGSLTTTGSANGGAKIGAVLKGDGATGTALTVADNGVLTVSQTDWAPSDQGIKLVNVDTLTIGKGAQLTAGITKAAVAASGQTPATPATYGDIEAGTLNVDGKLDASNSTVTVTSGATFTGDVASTVKTLSLQSGATVSVGTNTAAGKLVVNNVSGNGTIFADPAFVKGVSQSHSTVAVETVSADSTVVAGQNSVVAVGFKDTAAADAAFAKTGFVLADTTAENAPANAVNSVLYVQGTKDANGGHVSATGKFAATNETSPTQYEQGVRIDKGSLLVVDASTVDATYGNTAVFSGIVNVEKGAKVYLANVVNGNTIKLSANEDAQLNGDVYFEGDLLLNEQMSGSTVTIKSADLKTLKSEFGDVAGIDAAWGMFDEGANLNNNSKSAAFNKWLYTSTSSAGVASGDRVDTVRLNKIAADVASLGATTGVQTMTMDAVNQMGETVADRVSLLTQRAAGVNVWAAANGGMFEAKSLFDGAGYESDIYSGVLGVDYQFACNAVLGAALTIGTADTDNKNSGVKASTDSDLVGFSVYTSKTFADVLGVSADIGYLTASNDVTANGYGQSWKFSQDTDAFTIGLRTEVLAEVGAVKLVPHIGIRYTALSTDGFEAGYKTEIDDQNIFQMPVGVTVSGDFQTGDWTVAPKFDLSFVPTFGDKDADLKLGITGVNATDDLAVRVIDSNPVQATLGVNATNGAWGFGLNYKLGVGSDDRMNNTFNVNVRYAF
ncbi:ESPR-type extended signal peptide-containing protein [Duodenibacillus massiliensis]|uniref:ESPR-type extended signal peptide-containing protein n=2 Tax=Duodenibacillus massiliensis TaxID=1852381 RepID=UPI0023A8EEB7|nr:ESPR-type extended signal peptide-containing protein [Duodenibacillus massiliensis]